LTEVGGKSLTSLQLLLRAGFQGGNAFPALLEGVFSPGAASTRAVLRGWAVFFFSVEALFL
jgi:hypothetical protein